MDFTGEQLEQLSSALLSAYDKSRLEEMLFYHFKRDLDEIAVGNMRTIVFKLLRTARREGWLNKLVYAARQSNPGNPELRSFAQQFGFALNTPPEDEIETIVEKSPRFFETSDWIKRLDRIEGQICRVYIPDGAMSTGFLIGPNSAVVPDFVAEGFSANPDGVEFRFDYKLLRDGTVNPGTIYHLAKSWCIDEGSQNQLNYCVVRIEGEPGNREVMENMNLHSRLRGWILLPEQEHEFSAGEALYVLHHSWGKALKLDQGAAISIVENGRTVKYLIQIEPGSSGAPIFSRDLDLVAVHVGKFPKDGPGVKYGVSISKIRELLESRKKLQLIYGW